MRLIKIFLAYIMPSLVYASGIGGGAVTWEGAKNNLIISFSVLLIGFLVLSLIKKIKVKFFIINMMLTAIKILLYCALALLFFWFLNSIYGLFTLPLESELIVKRITWICDALGCVQQK